MTDAVRVCVVGVGRAGMVHARNFRWHVRRAQLVAVVDSDGERAQVAARELDLPQGSFPSLDAALEAHAVEAVVVTSPTFTHAELACLAAERGKHILCEKPMALTLAECDQMIAAAAAQRVVLQIGFMRRFDPPFVEAKRQIAEGRIGRPLVVRSLTRGPGLPPAWAQDPRQSNGMLAEVNSHDFDTVRWLGGGDLVRVYAQAGANKVPELREKYPAFYDTAVVMLQLDNGTMGMLDGVCPAGYAYDARAEVVGTEGVLLIGELRQMALTRVTREEGQVERHHTSWPSRFRDAYLEEAAHFISCIVEGKPPQADGQAGRCALEGVLAANRSIASGLPVDLPLPAQEVRSPE